MVCCTLAICCRLPVTQKKCHLSFACTLYWMLDTLVLSTESHLQCFFPWNSATYWTSFKGNSFPCVGVRMLTHAAHISCLFFCVACPCWHGIALLNYCVLWYRPGKTITGKYFSSTTSTSRALCFRPSMHSCMPGMHEVCYSRSIHEFSRSINRRRMQG